MSVSFIVFLHIEVGLSSIGARMVVKCGDKGADRHCSGEAFERQERTDINDWNGDSCSVKESVAIRSEYYTKKESTKGLKGFDEEPSMAELGNRWNEVSDASGTVFCSTFKRF